MTPRNKVLKQLKTRRTALGFTQDQMMLRVGMSRQQYQRLELRGNPTLKNLELLAKGLKMQLMLIPQEKLQAVKAVLDGEMADGLQSRLNTPFDENALPEDPWKGLLDEDE